MRKISGYFITLIIVAASCSPYEQVLKSKDTNVRFTKANEYYEDKKWSRANELYETLIPTFRGTKNFEELYYRYANSYYEMGDYLSASYQFKNFTEFFPGSTRLEETEFLYALSLYKMTNKTPYDQSSTVKAIQVLQNFINLHSNSPKVVEANKYIDECRARLEEKDAHAAKLYYDLKMYNSAGIAYKSVIETFPESSKQDFYQLMIVKSIVKYAENSIKERQEERYADALTNLKNLKDYYPNSSYIHEALSLEKNIQSTINKLRNEQ